ncbi:hypothetical protein RDI58_007069 [Solanum bulbocastanum]|uniref:Inositol-1-monophosphatase n=1 Tax=Solanum bulbocastanum TaxID=147425 RepID=A0AAN8YIV4_SOLBU
MESIRLSKSFSFSSHYKNLRVILPRLRSKSSNSSQSSPRTPKSSNISRRNSSREDEFREVFRHFDTDNDGKISAFELRAYFGSVGEHMSHEDAQEIVDELDTDGDNFINFEDFKKLLMQKEGSSEEDESLKSAFEMYELEKAEKAGEIIRQGIYKSKHAEHKGVVDLVTETDKACEDSIFNHLKQCFPSHKFIGEETTGAASGGFELADEPTWIVVHGFPFVCVSIGLTIEKKPVVGVVYNPIIDEIFTAIDGRGAFLNGKPIRVSSESQLVKALVATEAGTNRDKAIVDATTKRINRLLFKVRSLRMSGSCALNLCGVACGRLDLFYEIEFGGPWDVAAGALIVTEAGGLVLDPSGSEFDLTARRVAATNAHLKDAFINALNESE